MKYNKFWCIWYFICFQQFYRKTEILWYIKFQIQDEENEEKPIAFVQYSHSCQYLTVRYMYPTL